MRMLLLLLLVFCFILVSWDKKPLQESFSTRLLTQIEDKGFNSFRKDTIAETLVGENDSVQLIMKFFTPADEWSPWTTEIWVKNKINNSQRLIVRSNPDSLFGSSLPYKYENDTYRSYPLDSIPTIYNCVLIPNSTKIIVDGPTCAMGWMAAFKIDWVSGKCYVLPSNDGFRNVEENTNNVVVASRFNDIDPFLAIWYEEISAITPTGKIIKKNSTKNEEIERHLPYIHSLAGLNIMAAKLLKHQTIKPKYNDEEFVCNFFEFKYTHWNDSLINAIKSLVDSNPKWRDSDSHYCYEEVDNDNMEYKRFLKIRINTQTKTGTIYTGSFSDIRNVPEFQNK